MKFYTITLMMFLINIAAAVVNTAGMFDGYQVQPQQGWIDDSAVVGLKDEQYFQSVAAQDVSNNLGFGDFVKGFWLFITTMVLGVVAPFYLLSQFGMPVQLAILLSGPIYIVYLAGLSQYLANRGFKTME